MRAAVEEVFVFTKETVTHKAHYLKWKKTDIQLQPPSFSLLIKGLLATSQLTTSQLTAPLPQSMKISTN